MSDIINRADAGHTFALNVIWLHSVTEWCLTAGDHPCWWCTQTENRLGYRALSSGQAAEVHYGAT